MENNKETEEETYNKLSLQVSTGRNNPIFEKCKDYYSERLKVFLPTVEEIKEYAEINYDTSMEQCAYIDGVKTLIELLTKQKDER